MDWGSSIDAVTGMSRSLMTSEKFASLLVWALKTRRRLAYSLGFIEERPARMRTLMIPSSGRNRSRSSFNSVDAGKTSTTGETGVGCPTTASGRGITFPPPYGMPVPVSRFSRWC